MDLSVIKPLNGYVLRPVRAEDTEAIIELINASKQAKMGKYATNLTKASYLSLLGLPNLNAELDRAVVSTLEGAMAGYAHVINRQSYMTNDAEIHVHAQHQRQGLGTCLTQWAEKRARQFIPLAPAARSVTLGCAVIYPDPPAQNMLETEGFKLVRHFWSLRAELTGIVMPQWPEGLMVRHKISGQDEAEIYRAVDETFRDLWGYVEVPFEDGLRRFMQRDVINNPAYDPTLWFLAMAGREIAGYAICREVQSQRTKIGYVDKLGVRTRWRQRGLGLALLQHSFNAFLQRNIQEVRLEVDAESHTGAPKLYEKAGMTAYLQKAIYQKVLRTDLA